MAKKSTDITLPRYNLPRIIQIRDRLADDVLTDYCGFVPEGQHFEDFVDRLCAGLGSVNRRAVWDSVRGLAGTLLRDADIRRTGWRMAANLDRLQAGTTVPPWHVQTAPEWMPVQVAGCEQGKSQRGKPGAHYRMRVMAGTACPMIITTFCSRSFIRVLGRLCGYTSYRHGSPLQHPSELVNMRLWVLVDPDYCRPGMPGFHDVHMSPGLRKWNRDIIKMRFRRDFTCPHSYDHPCFRCPVGYTECPAAVRRETSYAPVQTGSEGDAGAGGGSADPLYTDGAAPTRPCRTD